MGETLVLFPKAGVWPSEGLPIARRLAKDGVPVPNPDPSPTDRRLYAEAVLRHWALWRELYPNLHALSPRAWRSGQPTPRLLRRWIRRLGLRSVICLREPDPRDPLLELERRVCAEAGVGLYFHAMYSRELPKPHELRGLHDLLRRIEYPVLIHCKGGADRAGLASTLYLHWMECVPLDRTRQLTLFPHLHFRSGKTGLLDWFFESYARETRDEPCPLLDWAETRMRRDELARAFRPTSLGVFITDKLLRRE